MLGNTSTSYHSSTAASVLGAFSNQTPNTRWPVREDYSRVPPATYGFPANCIEDIIEEGLSFNDMISSNNSVSRYPSSGSKVEPSLQDSKDKSYSALQHYDCCLPCRTPDWPSKEVVHATGSHVRELYPFEWPHYALSDGAYYRKVSNYQGRGTLASRESRVHVADYQNSESDLEALRTTGACSEDYVSAFSRFIIG
jgi:hypothetical protein